MSKIARLLVGLAALASSASVFAQQIPTDGAILLPEPGSLGLLAAGIAGLVAVRLFRRK